ncbi:hypothetical protein PLICRDRAFT_169250 [Plicaturopsis crispa FD-325 SS-3]|nr:hypothetical protein PLICRDRAFT_169250 [Plicaturopsis crispa FD-325 SS-3]
MSTPSESDSYCPSVDDTQGPASQSSHLSSAPSDHLHQPSSPPASQSTSQTRPQVSDTPAKRSSNGPSRGYATVEQMKEDMKAELEGAWVDGGADFISRFAQKDAIDRLIMRNASASHTDASAAVDAFLNDYAGYSNATRKWTTIPQLPAHEDELNTPFNRIFSDILSHFKLDGVRRVADTHNVSLPHVLLGEHSELRTSPDATVIACGSKSIAPSSATLHPVQKHIYRQAASVIDFKVDSTVDSRMAHNRVQLGVYARECFVSHQGRRFVYTALVTQTRIRILLYDRCGVMSSAWVNIHEDPVTFVRVILGLCLDNEAELGYDTNIYWNKGSVRVILAPAPAASVDSPVVSGGPRVEYVIVDQNDRPSREPFASRQTVRGRGAACWRVKYENKIYVIKDCWRPDGREKEWELLEIVRSEDGVGKIFAYDESADATISGIRPGADNAAKRTPVNWASLCQHIPRCEECCTVLSDRTFSRIVLESYGRPLEKFNTRKQLLCALYDAVNGHWNLWKKKILHRDISKNNILLGSDALDVAGNRGILIDLDLAIKIHRDHALQGDWRTGTRAFQSINVLEGDPWCHSHEDDLESFLYVLCWICHLYISAHNRHKELPAFLRAWEDGTDHTVATEKYRFLTETYQYYRVSAWFSPVFDDLIGKLAEFCAERYRAKRHTMFISLKTHKPEESEEALRKIHSYNLVDLNDEVPSPVNSNKASQDFTKFMGIIQSAIDELGDEPDRPTSPPFRASPSPLATGVTAASPTTSGPAKKRKRQDKTAPAQVNAGSAAGSSQTKKRRQNATAHADDYRPSGNASGSSSQQRAMPSRPGKVTTYKNEDDESSDGSHY